MINEENKIKHKEEAKKDFGNTNYYKEFESNNLNNNELDKSEGLMIISNNK